MIDQDTKKLLRDYGFLVGFLIIISGILVPFILLNRSSWNSGLAERVEFVLDEKMPHTYRVGTPVRLQSALSASAAAYTLIDIQDTGRTESYGIIVRIPTFYGPQPAVFVCNHTGSVHFIGYAVPQGKITNTLSGYTDSDPRITYWKLQIAQMLAKKGELK
jgi:hypothetical protein